MATSGTFQYSKGGVAYESIPDIDEEGADIHQYQQSQRQSLRSVRESVRMLIHASLVFDGAACSVRDFGGNATIPSEVANLTKNVIGAGVLSLSGGIAIYADSPSAVYWAFFWIAVVGTVFGYFCLLIAKVCKMTGSATYRECWEETMGDRGALAVALVAALVPAASNLAFSVILSQTFQSLLETVGIRVTRIQVLLVITVVALLPLCLIKNLHVLAPFSVLGIAGVLYTAAAMLVRCVDGSYQPGGIFYDDIPADRQPMFGSRNQACSAAILPFICMVFQSWVMHFNSPRFYTELKHASIPRFAQAVGYSFGFAAAIFMTIAAAGFWTFGGTSSGYIVNNYSAKDPIMTVSRLAIALSIILSYPLMFVGFRDGVLDCLEIPPALQTSSNLNLLSVVLLTIVTITAMFVTDLGLINTLAGGTLVIALVFVFPALMYEQAVRKQARRTTLEAWVALALMGVGVVVGLTGVWVSL
jgi:amino acid permease